MGVIKQLNRFKKFGLLLLSLSLLFATIAQPKVIFAAEEVGNLSDDMQFSGTVKSVETPWGKGASFNSEKINYLDSTTTLDVTDSFTLQFWFNINSSNEKSNIMFQFLDDDKNIGRSVLYHRDGKLGTYIDGNNISFDEPIPLKKWVNAALKIDKKKAKVFLYLNGKKVDEKSLDSNRVSSGAFRLRIGAHKELKDSTVNRYEGKIDQIHVVNKLLSEAEILSNFTTEKESIIEKPDIPLEKTSISIQTNKEIDEIPAKMFGINHRYANDGYSSWDVKKQQIFEDFEVEFQKANFGSVRYPGGTVSNLFEWKKSIGPVEDRKKTIHGLPYEESNKPIEPNFGLDEVARWLEENNSEMIYVYGMGNGSAQDAGDLVEYLNAEVGENPNGGIDWAQVRADNGHYEPYGIKSFELGNEMNLWIQDYWMSGNTYGSLLKAYVFGGEMDFTKDSTDNVNSYRLAQELVDNEDWRRSQRFSDESKNQVKYIRYNPVVKNSETILVDGKAWEKVDDISTAGAKDVYEIDYKTGEIVFGDGINGNIPSKGAELLAKYKTIQDGFNEIYQQMKAVDPEISIYSGYEDNSFIDLMGKDYPYDGIAIHPYSGNSISVNDEYLYEKIMKIGRDRALVDSKNIIDHMRKVSGKNLNAALSEFGIYNYNDDFISSQTHALYIANSIIDFMDVGVDYINKHTLIDYPAGDSLGPGKQAVIQAFQQEDGSYEYVSTPSARVFELLNNYTGEIRIANEIKNNTKISDNSDVDAIKVLTSKSKDGKVYAFVVNTDRNHAKDLNIKLPEGEYYSKVFALESENHLSVNTVKEPDNVQLEQLTDLRSDENMFNTVIEPHSIKVFEISELPTTDKALLQDQILKAEKLLTDKLSDDSFTRLKELIIEAKAVYKDDLATQKLVDQQITDLKKLMNALNYKAAYLSDETWERATSGDGENPKKDSSVDGKTISLTDNNREIVKFKKGLGVQAQSEILYDISDGDYNHLTTWVGADPKMSVDASLQFTILVDDVPKYTSKMMTSTTPMEYAVIDITGGEKLKLVVKDVGSSTGSNDGSWADIQLHVQNPIVTDTTDVKQYEDMELVFNEEFNGEKINEEKWTLVKTPENGTHNYVNKVGKNENIWVENGNLVIQAKKYKGSGNYSSTSAAIATQGKFDFRYGRVDVRAKIPTETGMWPAIWMMPENPEYGWPMAGEIDIMELISNEPNKIWSTLHSGISETGNYFNQSGTLTIDQGTYYDDYYIYSMVWEPGVISFYVNDVLVKEISDWQNWVVDYLEGGYEKVKERDYPAPFDKNFFLKLNLATGGWSQDVDQTTRWGDRTSMKVDYVRVYQDTRAKYDYSADKPYSNEKHGAIWYGQRDKAGTWENYENYDAASKTWISAKSGVRGDGNDWAYISHDGISANFNPTSDYTRSAIGFRAPYAGYIKAGLKDEVKTNKQGKVTFNLTTGDKTSTESEILRTETFTGTTENLSARKTYIPVTEDEMIRFEILKSDNAVNQYNPIVEYVSESEYQAFKALEVQVEKVADTDTKGFTSNSVRLFEEALAKAEKLLHGTGDEAAYINAMKQLEKAFEGLKENQVYVVSFDLQGGVGADIPAQKLTHGELATKPELEPSLEGSVFKYWSKEPEGYPYFFNTSITANTVLYAVYEIYTPLVGEAVPENVKAHNRENWSYTANSSHEQQSIANLFDGDSSTHWHSDWSGTTSIAWPYEITIDLEKNESVYGFSYLPRQDKNSTGLNQYNGRVNVFEIYAGTSEKDAKRVIRGKFDWQDGKDFDNTVKFVAFDKPIEASYIAFKIISAGADNNQQLGSGAEFNLYKESKIVDKSVLAEKITEAKAINTTGKSEESIQQLQNEILAAEAILADEDASQKVVAAQIIALEEAMNGLVDDDTRPTALKIKQQIEFFEEEEGFNDDSSARALKTHLTAVSQYEKQEAAKKVVKHMESFQLLLDHQLKNDQISKEAYEKIKADSALLIQNWQ